jgi:hypothetical protein
MPVKRMNAVVLTATVQTVADIVHEVGEGIAIWTIPYVTPCRRRWRARRNLTNTLRDTDILYRTG